MTTRHGSRRLVAALATSALLGTGALVALPPAATAAPDGLDAVLRGLDRVLGAEFDRQDTTVRRGEQFTVSGRIGTLADGLAGTLDNGVGAAFTLQIVDPAGTVLGSQEITAGPLGGFSTTVPGSVTRQLPTAGRPVVLAARAVDASFDGLTEADAGATAITIAADDTGLQVENSFVSAVGWVKPGEAYPSRIILTNPAGTPVTDVTVTVRAAAVGSDFVDARAALGTVDRTADTVTWTVPSVPAATDATTPGVATLVLEHEADTLAEEPTLVWRDLSTTATVEVAGEPQPQTVTSHGPRVIPPGEQYDTARYGDRPFPVVPVDYFDKKHQEANTGRLLEAKLNSDDPTDDIGSTFELFQEMSLGQLFPHGTVPSADLTTAGWDYEGGFPFTNAEPAGTCTGVTVADSPVPVVGTPLYAERVTNGWYQLPGTTQYYGADKFGSAVVGALGGVGALMDIDSACGPTGKLVWDAAAIADPEIDYSDYDTDKDGVVDFFMVVFAGCGGNGASQLGAAACPYPTDALPSDNVWPHSSSLEYGYTDPETGLTGFVTDDQLKDNEGNPLFYTSAARNAMTTATTEWPVMVRVGPYNVNPETSIDNASVISHEYGHSLGLPDFYSLGGRETYGDWNLMATDKSQHMDVFSRVEMGWVVPEVLDGDRTVTGMTDSKEDTHRIVWQRPDGTPYELTGEDVHNSQAFVAKLPGRKLIDESVFDSGEKATETHAWWSGSGNDFGCAPQGGRNLDLAVPGLADLPAGSTVELSFKSAFDIEWDFDYGFVLASTDGGRSWTSQESEAGTTTSNSTPLVGNPNQNGCQATFGNGITGTSGSYAAGSEQVDRLAGNYPPMEFLTDTFDVSELAGAENPVLRFSYATDPGLARPGWFVDDLKVVATTPAGEKVLLQTDFESDGGPDDPRVFNGGCSEDFNASGCTPGWSYVEAGAEAVQDHAYLLELRDRSGFDVDGRGENDRDPITFQPGLSLVYTDEAHGYGNVGTDNPPAQSPLDANPEPGSDTPDLSDAAWKKGGTFTDSGEGHTDNYTDPANTEADSRYDEPNPWRFRHDCLGFEVVDLTGAEVGPVDPADGDLTGTVEFDMGAGCGEFDHGYAKAPAGPTPNQAPVAAADAKPAQVQVGQEVTFDATDSTDAESPQDLDYVWDFGDGGSAKDAAGVVATRTYAEAGTYTATVTVTDPQGATDTASVDVVVTGRDGNEPPAAKASAHKKKVRTGKVVKLSSAGTSDAETATEDLTYEWDFDDGGSDVDSTSASPRVRFEEPGIHVVTLTVTDADGAQDTDRVRIRVREHVACEDSRVKLSKGWKERSAKRARGDRYCELKRDPGSVRMRFEGPKVSVLWGKARPGGKAVVLVDGERVGRLDFRVGAKKPVFNYQKTFQGLGAGKHTLTIKVKRGAAYLDELRVYR